MLRALSGTVTVPVFSRAASVRSLQAVAPLYVMQNIFPAVPSEVAEHIVGILVRALSVGVQQLVHLVEGVGAAGERLVPHPVVGPLLQVVGDPAPAAQVSPVLLLQPACLVILVPDLVRACILRVEAAAGESYLADSLPRPVRLSSQPDARPGRFARERISRPIG